ncbi:MAG: multiheme c-type cytochrome [Aureliella sp.]
MVFRILPTSWTTVGTRLLASSLLCLALSGAPALAQTPAAGERSADQRPPAMRYSRLKLPSLLVSGSDDDLLATPLGGDGLDELEAMSQQPADPLDQTLRGAGHGQDRPTRDGVPEGADPHANVFAETLYPSALKCAKCHQKIYDEWRVSSHAYAAVSPMFQRFEQAMTNITKGTIGYFCIRCHAPVATQMEFPREAPLMDGPAVFREGITCVACHRVVERYGRVNGERRIEPGDIFQPVVGNLGGQGIAQVIADADNYKVKLDPSDKRPGQEMHRGAIKFEQLSESAFCVSCHQVVVHPGVALEVVWAQYRASPARARGATCQDCHMGLEPGKDLGYECAPAAIVDGKAIYPGGDPSRVRKHSNHMFHGPGNSIAHPGLFPHNEKSLRWNVEQWLEFDWRAGWGTPEFEKQFSAGGSAADRAAAFPPNWSTTDERRDARKVLDENFQLLALKREYATRTLANGAVIDGPAITSSRRAGEDLHVQYVVRNQSDGHNLPTGSLGAQPQLWLNVVLTGPDGRWLWESGYLDGNGDLADQHSLQVRKGLIPPDHQLLNLQTKFLITGVKGTDREMYLPVNVDIDQLPFLRPGALPITVLNHPPFVRMEAHSVPALGARPANYRIPGHLVEQPGTYRLSVRLRSRMEPIYFMRFCTATPEMERRMLEQTLDVHPQAVEFEIY